MRLFICLMAMSFMGGAVAVLAFVSRLSHDTLIALGGAALSAALTIPVTVALTGFALRKRLAQLPEVIEQPAQAPLSVPYAAPEFGYEAARGYTFALDHAASARLASHFAARNPVVTPGPIYVGEARPPERAVAF